MPTTYQLRTIPDEIRKIIIEEQAEQIKKKTKIISQESVIYKIIKEWKELKSGIR